MKSARIAVFAVLVVIGAGCNKRWKEVDQFVGALRCGQTSQEVQALAERFGPGVHFGFGSVISDFNAGAGKDANTVFLRIGPHGLEAYQRRDFPGLTAYTLYPTVNLCKPVLH